MSQILTILSNKIIFWSAWIIIPLIVEIIPSIVNFFILLHRRIHLKEDAEPIIYPEISLLIPVYNSSGTLRRCIKSINDSDYDNNLIDILLIDNGSSDDSFEVYKACQIEFPNLSMNWIKSGQGKAIALNEAIFNSEGKYIINIDSDGALYKDALKNIVKRFENNMHINCMTGTVLTDPSMINDTDSLFLRLFRKLEFMEYCQAFLAGRNFASLFNSIYTLSGACSAFRKSTLLKTQMYNTETICEDTHLTFQIKNLLKERVYLCENAIFMVDPIEGFNKFYTQRQRWQIGELEVSHMFMDKSGKNVFRDSSFRTLIFDHTFAFSRFIWYFILIILAFSHYSFHMVIAAALIIYVLYIFCGFLYYLNILSFLKDYKDLKKYYRRRFFLLFLLPLYQLVSFFIRFAGIINSTKRKSSWKTFTLTEEIKLFFGTIFKDFAFIGNFRNILRRVIEVRDE